MYERRGAHRLRRRVPDADFTYIDDVVGANLALLETDVVDGEAMNIGLTDNIAIKTLAEEFLDQLAPGVELEYQEHYDADAEYNHADTSKAAELLGYESENTIREGVGKLVEWYEADREWYAPLVLNS